MRGHVGDDHVVDVDLKLVELRVLGLDRVADLVVALDQGAHGEGEVAVGQAGHHEQRLADVGELFGGGSVRVWRVGR